MCVAVGGQHGGRSEQTGGGGVHLHTLLRTWGPQDIQRELQVRIWFRDVTNSDVNEAMLTD